MIEEIKITEDLEDFENEKWECYLCCREDYFKGLPSGYLANYHPLCMKCADYVFYDKCHSEHFRLTYHDCVGDIAQ